MRSIKWKTYWVFLIGIISLAAFLGFSYLKLGSFGFPLDDGWIHQTYARNLAQSGDWAYIPGKTSGGSTSPLWTLLLSLVHLSNSGPFWGTFFIATLLFVITGFVFQCLADKYISPASGKWLSSLPVFSIFFYLEWHMNWAAASGMEIMLYVLLILLFFLSLTYDDHPWLPGLIIGLAFWTRPDGITLLGPLYFVLTLAPRDSKMKWEWIWKSTFAFLPFLAAYFIFNRLTAGTWWPNTFYAKQSEYAVLYETALVKRLLHLAAQPWISPSIVLIPGIIYKIIQSIRKSEWAVISMVLWAFGYILVYAVRLPVIYQHARYLMPTMPIFYFLGLIGTLDMLEELKTTDKQTRLIKFGTISLTVMLLVGFWFMGLSAYGEDCAIIHEEMVGTSIWIKENIPESSLIAAHDIGALGYYGEHDILDLAGLITPEVIPFIRNEDELLDYLEAQEVQYLMTFTDWYEELPETGQMIYVSSGEAIRRANGESMAVYEYNWSKD